MIEGDDFVGRIVEGESGGNEGLKVLDVEVVSREQAALFVAVCVEVQKWDVKIYLPCC